MKKLFYRLEVGLQYLPLFLLHMFVIEQDFHLLIAFMKMEKKFEKVIEMLQNLLIQDLVNMFLLHNLQNLQVHAFFILF